MKMKIKCPHCKKTFTVMEHCDKGTIPVVEVLEEIKHCPACGYFMARKKAASLGQAAGLFAGFAKGIKQVTDDFNRLIIETELPDTKNVKLDLPEGHPER